MRIPYADLPPEAKAILDYQVGGDQSTNPYNKTANYNEWESYAIRMGKLQQKEFQDLILQKGK